MTKELSSDALLRQLLTDNLFDITQPRSNNDASLASLISGLISDAQQLVRREVDLAKQEVLVEVDKAKQGAIALGIGGVVVALGALLLVLMLVYGLAAWFNLALWVAYLIVGGLFAIIGTLLLVRGLSRLKQVNPLPHETIEEVQKDIAWLKEQQ